MAASGGDDLMGEENYGATFKKLFTTPMIFIGFAFWFISGLAFVLPLMDGPRKFERQFNVIQTDAGKAGWLIIGGVEVLIMVAILFFAFHQSQTGSEAAGRIYMGLIKLMMCLLIPYWICILFL